MRLRRTIAVALALPLLALAGCGNAGDQSDGGGGDGAGDAAGSGAADPAPTAPVSCPDRLAEAEGVPPPAEVEAPTWPELTEGVLCTYTFGDDGWTREGEEQDVPAADLAGVVEQVGSLEPVTPDQMCTMDMGLRHLLVAASDEGTVAVAVDAFGCRDTTFTNDPAGVPAGEAGTALAPQGRFSATPALLELVGAGA